MNILELQVTNISVIPAHICAHITKVKLRKIFWSFNGTEIGSQGEIQVASVERDFFEN